MPIDPEVFEKMYDDAIKHGLKFVASSGLEQARQLAEAEDNKRFLSLINMEIHRRLA